MQPQVLYYCPCDRTTASETTSKANGVGQSSSTHGGSSQAHPPNLPAYSAASRHAFHQLETLYFCDECDQIRCNRCVTVDISSYFCPNCLFEVPGASVKAEKNRCARNCFLCPCCTHVLSVLASETDESGVGDSADAKSSQGRQFYYLGCTVCKWDSKHIGLTFEKATGLSLHLQRLEDNAYDVLELDRLKAHFDPFLKAQTRAAATSQAIGKPGASSISELNGQASARVAGAMNDTRRASGSKSNNDAASAALKRSKLLRDLPSLSASKYLLKRAGLNESAQTKKVEPEELKPYDALTSWKGSVSDTSPFGTIGKRERHRRDYLAHVRQLEGDPGASTDTAISSLAQRFRSMPEQPLRVQDLKPTRVPLQTKQSKRCPACRHIVIKPDLKAASNRFKIKLVAMNYLPEFEVRLAAEQPFVKTPSAKLDSSSVGSSLRKALAASTDSSGNTATNSSFLNPVLTSNDVDTGALKPGQTYSFQLRVTNPLDDSLRVKVNFVRVLPPSAPAAVTDPGRELQDSRYIFASAGVTAPAGGLEASPEQQTPDHVTQQRTRSRYGWKVHPSAMSFPLNAINEVWELEESVDLLDKKSDEVTTSSSTDVQTDNEFERVMSDFSDGESDEYDVNDATAGDRTVAIGSSRSYRGRRAGVWAAAQRKPFMQKGHNTIVPIDLTISKRDAPAAGHPIEIAMHVTYSYSVDENNAQAHGSSQGVHKDFSFWTALRLGTVGT